MHTSQSNTDAFLYWVSVRVYGFFVRASKNVWCIVLGATYIQKMYLRCWRGATSSVIVVPKSQLAGMDYMCCQTWNSTTYTDTDRRTEWMWMMVSDPDNASSNVASNISFRKYVSVVMNWVWSYCDFEMEVNKNKVCFIESLWYRNWTSN